MKPDSEIRPVVRLHLWLETQKGVFFGLGRMMLTPETWFTTGAAKRTLIDRRQEQSIA